MTDAILAYTAGIIDGEGSILAAGARYELARLQLSVANTSQELMNWLATTWGGHINPHRARTNKHKASYFWARNGADAAKILMAVAPFLQAKRRQAAVGLELHRVKELGGGRHGFRPHPPEIRWQVEVCAKLLRALNRRGPRVD